MTDPWIIAAILSKALLYVGILGAAGSVFAARLIGPDLGAYRRVALVFACLLYTSPSPRDRTRSRMPSSA